LQCIIVSRDKSVRSQLGFVSWDPLSNRSGIHLIRCRLSWHNAWDSPTKPLQVFKLASVWDPTLFRFLNSGIVHFAAFVKIHFAA